MTDPSDSAGHARAGSSAARPAPGAGFWLGLAIATLVGAALRVALASSSGLWRDEVQALEISRLPTLPDLFAFLVREDSHPPLFYLVERLWVHLFGVSDSALVALGLLPGVLLIPVAGGIAGRFSGRGAGLLAAAFLSVAWPLVWQAGDARPYAFLSLATFLTTVTAVVACRTRSTAAWLAYAVGCLVMLYTHNWWVLVVATLAVITLADSWWHTSGRRAALKPWLAAHGALALVYLPWVPVVLAQARSAGYAGHARFPGEWLVIVPTLQLGVTFPLLLPAAALILLGAWGVREAGQGAVIARRLFLGAAMPCLLALVTWTRTDLMSTYCAVALSPLLLVAVACALGTGKGRARAMRGWIAAVLFLAMLGVTLKDRWYLKSNVREAALLVSAHAEEADLVLVFPSSMGPVYQRYDASGAQVIVYPPQTPTRPTEFAGWWRRFDEPEALARTRRILADARRAGRTVWLVSQLRVDHSPDSTAPVGTRDRFRYSVGARIRDLRTVLREEFGQPDSERTMVPVEWRRELVKVERYSGGAKVARSSVPGP